MLGATTAFGVTKSDKRVSTIQKGEQHSYEIKDDDVLAQYWTKHLQDLQKEYAKALREQDMVYIKAVLEGMKRDLTAYKKYHIKELDNDKQKILKHNRHEKLKKVKEIEIERDIYKEVTDYLRELLSE